MLSSLQNEINVLHKTLHICLVSLTKWLLKPLFTKWTGNIKMRLRNVMKTNCRLTVVLLILFYIQHLLHYAHNSLWKRILDILVWLIIQNLNKTEKNIYIIGKLFDISLMIVNLFAYLILHIFHIRGNIRLPINLLTPLTGWPAGHDIYQVHIFMAVTDKCPT